MEENEEETKEKKVIRVIRCHLSRRDTINKVGGGNKKASKKSRLVKKSKRMPRFKGSEQHFQVLEQIVKTISNLHHRQSLLTNAFTVRCCERGEELPIFDNLFFAHISKAAYGKRWETDDIFDTRLQEVADELNLGTLPVKGLSQVIGMSVCEEYCTKFQNYCQVNPALRSHIKSYLAAKYDLERRSSVAYIYKNMWKLRMNDEAEKWNGEFPKEFTKRNISEEQVDKWIREEERILPQRSDEEYVRQLHGMDQDLLEFLKSVEKKKPLENIPNVLCDGRSEKKIRELSNKIKGNIKDTYYGLVTKYRHYMLSVIDQRINEKQQEVQEGDEDDKVYLKRFSLAPLSTVGRKFVRVDNSKVHRLGGFAKTMGVKDWNYTSIDDMFNRYGLMGQKYWKYTGSVKTNGVELHVTFELIGDEVKKRRLERQALEKAKQPEDKKRKREQDEKKKKKDSKDYDIDPNTDKDKTWFVDLGCKKPVSACRLKGCIGKGCQVKGCKNRKSTGDSDMVHMVETFSISSKEYHEKTGSRSLQRHMKRTKPDSVTEAEKQLAESGSLKVSGYEQIKKAIAVRMKYEPVLMKYYGTREIANRKFHKKNKRCEYLHEIADRLTENGTCTVIFGDMGRHTGIKGCQPGGAVGELQKLIKKKKFQSALAGEGLTSRKSYCCGADLKYMYGWKEMEDGSLKRVQNKGVCHCQACHATLSRDLNSAANIGRVARATMDGRSRPSYLVKKEKISKVDEETRLDLDRQGCLLRVLKKSRTDK